jgi:hypothetical protein
MLVLYNNECMYNNLNEHQDLDSSWNVLAGLLRVVVNRR